MTSTVCISILEVKDVKDIENRKQHEQSNCTFSALNPIFLEQYLPLKTPVWFENSALAAVVLVQIWCGNIIYIFYPTRSLWSITVIYDPRVRWNICVPRIASSPHACTTLIISQPDGNSQTKVNYSVSCNRCFIYVLIIYIYIFIYIYIDKFSYYNKPNIMAQKK